MTKGEMAKRNSHGGEVGIAACQVCKVRDAGVELAEAAVRRGLLGARISWRGGVAVDVCGWERVGGSGRV